MRCFEPRRAASFRRVRGALGAGVLCALLSTAAGPAWGHKASDAYLDLRPDRGGVAVRWDVAVRDLDPLLDLDVDGDGVVRWSELERRMPVLVGLMAASIRFDAAGAPCIPSAPSRSLARRDDGSFVVLRFALRCPAPSPSRIAIRYGLLADIDPTHRAIVTVGGSGAALTLLRPSDEAFAIELVAGDPRADTANTADTGRFVIEGFRHVLYGPDHLAFLLALLIAALASPTSGGRQDLRVVLGGLVATVSVFTLAHSITLVLSALSWIGLPSRAVEAAVALSVAVAGAQALVATTLGSGHRLARVPLSLVFGFGLVHGIGFGSSLAASGLTGRPSVSALLGFNLGVEAGQLAALATVLPMAWTLVGTGGFRRWGLPSLSFAVSAAGLVWFGVRLDD